MLLVMDVGNTNIKVGVFEGDKLLNSWRMESKPGRTADEYAVTLLNILERAGLHVRQIEGVVMSSVIPSLNYTLEHMVEYYIRKPMIVAGPGVNRVSTSNTRIPRRSVPIGLSIRLRRIACMEVPVSSSTSARQRPSMSSMRRASSLAE